jgi:membrane fusion protein (multidrug efflux system)
VQSGETANSQKGAIPAVRVNASVAESARLARNGLVTGIVSAFRKATVSAEVPGRVVSRRIEPGDTVEFEQIMIELDDDRAVLSLRNTQAQAQAQRVDMDHAQHEFTRGQGLRRQRVISQDALDDLGFAFKRARSQYAASKAQVAIANRNLTDTKIKAPFSGTAEIVHVQQGDYLNPGTPVVTLTNFDRARLIAGVSSEEAASLLLDQEVDVTFAALGGKTQIATLKRISRIKDTSSSTFPVEFWLSGTKLLEGMVGSIQLPVPAQKSYPTVPRSAVFRRQGKLYVFRVVDNKAELLAIETGRSDDNFVNITKGIAAGDLIVTKGIFALSDGAAVIIET